MAFARRQYLFTYLFTAVTVLVSGGILLAIEVPKLANPLQPYDGLSVRGVDTSALTGKLRTGYQGWFTCEGHGAGLGWTHWARKRSKPFSPGNVTVGLFAGFEECYALIGGTACDLWMGERGLEFRATQDLDIV